MTHIVFKVFLIVFVSHFSVSQAAQTITVPTDKSAYTAADLGSIKYYNSLGFNMTGNSSNTDGYVGSAQVGIILLLTEKQPFQGGKLTVVLNDYRDRSYWPYLQASYGFKELVRLDVIESIKVDDSKKTVRITGKAHNVLGEGYEETYNVSYELAPKFDKNKYLLPLIDVTVLKKEKVKANDPY